MKIEGIITMIFVIGIVWGGLFLLLYKALKFERRKNNV